MGPPPAWITYVKHPCALCIEGLDADNQNRTYGR